MKNILSRRDFLKASALGSVGAAAAIMLASCSGETAPAQSSTSTSNTPASTNNNTAANNTQSQGMTAAEFAAQENNEKDEEADYSNLVIGMSSLTKTFSPTGFQGDYCGAVYQSLSGTEGGDMYPCMAKSLEFTEDLMHVNCELRDNIYDTNGNHITASDVAFSYQLAMDASLNSVTRYFSGWDVTGEYTITFHLKNLPKADGIAFGVAVFSQKSYEASEDQFSTIGVGTGPYKIRQFVPDYIVVLEKNTDYWAGEEEIAHVDERFPGMWAQNWDVMEFRQIGESMQVVIALEGGDILFSDNVNTEDLVLFEEGGQDADDFTVYKFASGITYCLVYNCDELSPLHDVRLRKAVSYAIDQSALIEMLFRGRALGTSEMCGSWLPDYPKEWDTEESFYRFNQEKARELLADAGYSEGLELVFLTNSDPVNANAAVAIQSMLREVGITVSLLSLDMKVANERKEADHSFWHITTNQVGAEDHVWKAFTRAYAYNERKWEGTAGYFIDEKLPELLDKISAYGGATEENVEEFHQYVKELCLGYGMFNRYNSCVAKKGLVPAMSPTGKNYFYNAFYWEKV